MNDTIGIVLFDENTEIAETPLNRWINESYGIRMAMLLDKNSTATLYKVFSDNENGTFRAKEVKSIPIFCYSCSYSNDPKNIPIDRWGEMRNLGQLLNLRQLQPGGKIYIINAHGNKENYHLTGDAQGKMIFDPDKIARDLSRWLPESDSKPFEIVVMACECAQLFCRALSFYCRKNGLNAKITGYTEIIGCIPKEFNIQHGHVDITVHKNPLMGTETGETNPLGGIYYAINIHKYQHAKIHREYKNVSLFELDGYKPTRKPYKITWHKPTMDAKNIPTYITRDAGKQKNTFTPLAKPKIT